MICYPLQSGSSRHIDGIGGLPKTKYSLARNKCTSRGHQIRPRGKNGRNSFHRMRMKMPRLGGSYVAAGAFSKKTVRDIIGRLEIACGK